MMMPRPVGSLRVVTIVVNEPERRRPPASRENRQHEKRRLPDDPIRSRVAFSPPLQRVPHFGLMIEMGAPIT